MKYLFALVFVSILSLNLLFAQQSERIIIEGNSLVGKVINDENVREVIGNVVMTQGEVRITCNKAIQYLSRNEAKLIGNVVAVQDTITVYAERAYYYGESKFTYSDTTVTLNDGHVTLVADTGYYYFDDDRAEFFNNVHLIDSANTLESNQLFYYNNIDKAVCIGDVRIYDDKSEIKSDSLLHYRNDDLSFAYSNIMISYPDNRAIITGGYLEDRGLEKYTYIDENPVLTQIDTSESGIIDTMIIVSKKMEAFQDSSNRFIASDSVEIVRGDFFSVNNYSIFYREEDKIVTHKRSDDEPQPIMWYDNSQLTGDSITVITKDNEIDWIDISGSSFIMSKIENYDNRFNQISGKRIKMYFRNGDLQKTEVFGNVLSYYYLFEDETANGLLKSSSEDAILLFKDNSISDVKLYRSIKSEYHPENIITGKEREFTLPSFIIHKNKPDKNSILRSISNFVKNNGAFN
jgi:lipopolysaccharide export system protein LptA